MRPEVSEAVALCHRLAFPLESTAPRETHGRSATGRASGIFHPEASRTGSPWQPPLPPPPQPRDILVAPRESHGGSVNPLESELTARLAPILYEHGRNLADAALQVTVL
jgi:hypothetical protein